MMMMWDGGVGGGDTDSDRGDGDDDMSCLVTPPKCQIVQIMLTVTGIVLMVMMIWDGGVDDDDTVAMIRMILVMKMAT